MSWFEKKEKKQPVWFVSHGWDEMPVEPNDLRNFLLQAANGVMPKKIIALSSHWKNAVACVGGDMSPQTIHDHKLSDPRLDEIDYTPSGDTALADHVRGLLVQSGMSCKLDAQRGLDSSIWGPLKLLWPHENIPVVPMSLPEFGGAKVFFKAGRALRGLREEGVLMISCGQCFESPRPQGALPKQTPDPRLITYMKKLKELLTSSVNSELLIESIEQLLKQAHNEGIAKESHYLPLFFHLGLGFDKEPHVLGHESVAYGVYGNFCYWLGEGAPLLHRKT